jgi:cell division protein FtsI (penicillin-binding protein 3)
VADHLAGLDSGGAFALNNPRLVRDAQTVEFDARSPDAWRATVRRRLVVAALLLAFWATGIVVRLVYLQVLQYDVLLARAERQQSQTIDINPGRGEITDRHGRVLATSVDGDVIYAVPSDVAEPERVAHELCRVLDGCDAREEASLLQRLHSRRDRAPVMGNLSEGEAHRIVALGLPGIDVEVGTGRTSAISVVTHAVEDPVAVADQVCGALDRCSADARETLVKRLSGKRDFVYIRKRATPAEAQRVAALGIDGIGFLKESRRYYPNRSLAAPLLGFVDAKNEGVGGLELVYERLVAGKAGSLIVHHDAQRRVIQAAGKEQPTAGSSLELTIDSRLQFIAERELRAALDEHGAEGGSVVMMDPHSGEILALASAPDFNPNDSSRVDRNTRVNRAVETIYEPGSTFKTFTAAAALEERVISPLDSVDSSMPCHFGSARPITDVKPLGVISFEKVIAKSSNCGTARVAVHRLGTERTMRYVSRFGFGQRASRDFPAESGGIVHRPSDLKEHDLARVAIGYTIAVTPLQMAAAMSAIANGGELVRPRVIRAVRRGSVREEQPREVIRRAISVDTATRLTAMLEEVVVSGTATAARIEGYTIAGKTGTARKLNPNGRGYVSEYMASFAGFFPSRDPAVAMIVVIDGPRRKGYYGGAVAAPVFKRIAEASLRYLAVPPNVDRRAPVVVTRGERVPHIAPVSVAVLSPDSPLAVAASADAGTMPDLSGLSARQAVRVIGERGLETRLIGHGFVVSQSIAPETEIHPGDLVEVRLTREPPPRLTGDEGALP